jgi:murein DD-endopeptidase MepM/ murein hydrolase activator NlpD
MSLGVWVTYCGLLGINPITTLREIIEKPSQARAIIERKRETATAKWAEVFLADNASASANAAKGKSPYASRPITSDWTAHKERGSLGGIDFDAPVGTPIIATMSGTITNLPNNGTGGNTVTVLSDNGWKEQYLHLSKFARSNGARIRAGAIIGYSGGAVGASGSGASTGPHIHWHYITPQGQRVNPLANLGKG